MLKDMRRESRQLLSYELHSDEPFNRDDGYAALRSGGVSGVRSDEAAGKQHGTLP